VNAVVSAFVLTAALVADATGGRLASGGASLAFDGVSTDSRTIAPGSLFIALVGDRYDAHDFVDDVLARGAAGVLVQKAPATATDAAVIVVPDTLVALQALARAIRKKSGARVIAITGSAGKTTTKEVTAELLSTRYRVFRNHGNLNNHIGLPISLLELRRGPEIAVVELGMNHEGEIRALIGIAEPDVRVWTNVGDAHLGHFGSREALAAAKAEVLEGAGPNTLIVANADDPLVMSHVARAAGRIVTFGEHERATVRATNVVDRGFDGTTARVVSPAAVVDLAVPLAGRAQLANVLAATTVALELGVPAASIEAKAASLQPVARRGRVSALARGARLVDDSYNASPSAVRAMLAAMAATAVNGRRIAVLGEMLELGDRARDLHEACGRAATEAGVDELVVIGREAADGLVDGARGAGMPASRIHRFSDSATAASAVLGLVGPGDLVLVKGSRGTRTDIVSDRLMEAA
jgi:UDP-N-acetylmuramoyl-tripeptide--D-alanyl-D-alanine ligase